MRTLIKEEVDFAEYRERNDIDGLVADWNKRH